MPIEVSCPECGVKLRAPDDKAGKRARCGKCGGRVAIPGPAEPGDEPVPMAIAVPDFEPSLTPIPPSARTPVRPVDGLKPKSSPKPPTALPPPPPPPPSEVLSLDDDPPPDSEAPPEPPAAGDPFAFVAPLAAVPKAGSKPRQTALEPAKGAAGTAGEEGPPRRSYVRPGERGSGRTLLAGVLLGAAAVGAAVGGVIVFNNRQNSSEPAKADEKPAETPPPAAAGAGEEKGKGGVAPREKGTPQKQHGAAPKAEPKTQGTTRLAGKYVLPKGARTFQVREAGGKSELTQEPSGVPVEVDVPAAAVRHFFTADDRVNRDVVVVWEAGEAAEGRGARFGVDTYSPTTGQRVGRFEYDGDGPAPRCDVSADGKLFAAATAGGTVGVWNVADRTPVLEGLDPYAEKPDHKAAGIAAVFFAAGANQLVTVSSAGAVHLFDTATRKPVAEFVAPGGVAGCVIPGKNVAADADRRSVVLAVGGVVYQLATEGGLAVAWKLELGGTIDRPLGIAAAGVPGRIALAFELGADDMKERALLFCLPNERPVVFRPPAAGGEPTGVSWSGTNMAVVSTARGALWVHVDDKLFLPLALADCADGRVLHAATESLHWYLVENPKDKDKSRLLALSLPPARFLDFLRAAEKREPLESPRLDEKGLWK